MIESNQPESYARLDKQDKQHSVALPHVSWRCTTLLSLQISPVQSLHLHATFFS